MEIVESQKFIFERAEDTSALSNFYCGLSSMDNFIHDKERGLEKYVKLRLTNLWIVKSGVDVIALFALSKGTLTLSSDDRNNLERSGMQIDEKIFYDRATYPSIEIDYLAISETMSRQSIGSFILNEIAKQAMADRLSATMFLTVEAIDTLAYSAVRFYKKNDFKDSEHGIIRNQNRQREGEKCDTRRMYRVLYVNC